jgi:hypothetical protein
MKNVNLFDEAKLGEIREELECVNAMSLRGMEIGVHPIKVIDIIKAVVKGDVKPYRNNRGFGSVNPQTVNNVANDLMLNALGEIKLSKDRDESTIVDGHGRTEGLIRRYRAGKLTDHERNFMVAVRIVPKSGFLNIYEKAADVVKHGPVERLTNPDFFFGSLFNRLHERVGEEMWDEFMKNKFYKQISYLFYRFSANKQGNGKKKPICPEHVTYSSVFDCRHETTPLELKQPKDAPFKVSELEMERLAGGIKFYVETFRAIDVIIEGNLATDKGPYKRLKNSAPFMAMIVIDVTSESRRYGTSIPTLATRIFRNMAKISDLTKGLTYASDTDTSDHEHRISTILMPLRPLNDR